MARQPLLPIRQKPLKRGSRRTRIGVLMAAVLVALLSSSWTLLYLQQRTLRLRAEALFADVQRIQVGNSSTADAQSVLSNWYRWGTVETRCGADGCSSLVYLRRRLPGVLTGYGNPVAGNLLARMTDHLGLRNSAVGAALQYKNGVVTGKAFSLEVMLPFRDWYAREGAYVPELTVSSNETASFTEAELAHVVPTYPYRVVRRMKGLYGLKISFMPQEPAAEKEKYMDFRFSCITQFSPCQSESEILPAASELMNRVF
jgi:hypothetical protein